MTPRKRRSPTPLSPPQQAYVRHYYPRGYGTTPIAMALFVGVDRVRHFLRTEGYYRHSQGGDQRRYTDLPPLPPLGTSPYHQPKTWTNTPTGDLAVWNRERWPGWKCHGEMQARRA